MGDIHMTDRSSPPSPETPPAGCIRILEMGFNSLCPVHKPRYEPPASPRSSLTAPTELTEALWKLESWSLSDLPYGETRTSAVKATILKVEEMFRALRDENLTLRQTLDQWVEEEGAMCPEDWGFKEYVDHLEKQISALRRERDELKKTVQNL